ncbi:MAG: prepilin-type N-terminal cleavage/methylation domain-containing protein [Lentisphaeria bacterium]|nr:prepilin-type N-terminal cleavage/methylation domain-containing protein [Lentisphaeria bacterium]
MKKRQNFTLIEMMAVMIIAAVLAVLAVPAFKALTTGSSVGETASVVKNALDMAQSRAISSRRYVAVVLDYQADRQDVNSNPADTQGVRIAQIRVQMDSTGTVKEYHFDGWLPDQNWQSLDYGALVICAWPTQDPHRLPSVRSGDNVQNNDFSNLARIRSVPVRDNANGTFNAYGLIFAPYGNLYQPARNLTLTVGEAKLLSGRWIFEDTDDNGVPTNILRLSINQFTGKTEFCAQ